MKESGRSLFYFGIYKIIASLVFIIYPKLVIDLFQFDQIPLIWFRVIGVFTLVVGVYYLFCGLKNDMTVIKMSAATRLGLAACGMWFMYTGELPKTILVVAFFDLAGSFWTISSINKEKKVKYRLKHSEFLDPITGYR